MRPSRDNWKKGWYRILLPILLVSIVPVSAGWDDDPDINPNNGDSSVLVVSPTPEPEGTPPGNSSGAGQSRGKGTDEMKRGFSLILNWAKEFARPVRERLAK